MSKPYKRFLDNRRNSCQHKKYVENIIYSIDSCVCPNQICSEYVKWT